MTLTLLDPPSPLRGGVEPRLAIGGVASWPIRRPLLRPFSRSDAKDGYLERRPVGTPVAVPRSGSVRRQRGRCAQLEGRSPVTNV